MKRKEWEGRHDLMKWMLTFGNLHQPMAKKEFLLSDYVTLPKANSTVMQLLASRLNQCVCVCVSVQ
jgi:hypothetical protein